MQSEAIILLGVSGEEADHLSALLTENNQIHCLVERAETKEQFLQKADYLKDPFFIVTHNFITTGFPDFSDYSNTQHTGAARILLCNRTESETAVQLLCNGFNDCLFFETLTAEKLANSIQLNMNTRQAKLSAVKIHSSAVGMNEHGYLHPTPDLQKFYERFIRISSTTNDAVWEWNLADNSLWANENHQHLFGLSVTDPVPAKDVWVDRIHPDDRQRILDMQDQALSSDTNVFISEYRLLTNEGYKYIFDRCYIERNSHGAPVLMTGSMMDITERKAAEEKIIHANERFELIARTTNEALWEMDILTGYTWSNETHQLLYGLSLQDEAPMLQKWEDSIHPDERVDVLKSFYDVFNSNENIWISEYRMINYKGEVIAIYDRTYIVRNSEGKPIRMMGSMMDITERKKAENELNHSFEAIRKLTSHLQQVREEERKHIARNIHDELGQLLTVLKMDVSWLNKKIKVLNEPAISQKTEEVLALLNNTVQSVRRIAADLRPGLLDDLGLTAAIEWHLSEFGNRTGIQTDFFTDKGYVDLPAEQATSLFRIYQESMTNITRHADATQVKVELRMENDGIIMRITDNGKGFDLATLSKPKTLGLLGMKERAEMMDGRFRISKQPEGGMQVEVQLPFCANESFEVPEV